MALTKWEPKDIDTFTALRNEVDHLFEDFTRGWPRAFFSRTLPTAGGEFLPSVDLKETDEAFTLTADLPGVARKELSVNISEGAVTIAGERREEREESDQGYHLKESSHGTFKRVINLPAEVVSEKAKASLKDGVLTLVLPKARASKRKEVQIKVD